MHDKINTGYLLSGTGQGLRRESKEKEPALLPICAPNDTMHSSRIRVLENVTVTNHRASLLQVLPKPLILSTFRREENHYSKNRNRYT